MGYLEIISAVCLILSCVFIIVMVLLQDSKKGMSQAITGGSTDNFYQRNSSRSKEAKLARATRTAAILFFVVTLIVNVFAIYFKGEGGSVDLGSDNNVDMDFGEMQFTVDEDGNLVLDESAFMPQEETPQEIPQEVAEETPQDTAEETPQDTE